MRVLIVEGDPEVREILAALLVEGGHEVATAAHGRAALDGLDAIRPDAILLDVTGGAMPAEQFRAEQRRRWRSAGIPVVVLADGAPGPGHAPRGRVLTRPVSIAEVESALGRLGADDPFPTPAPGPGC